jgi:N-acetyl-anhydromuramyl-L-alanine amidase AmpD
MISPLATVPANHNPARKDHRVRTQVHSYVVHMTGSSIVSKAIKKGVSPIEECLRYYCGKRTSSHYLIGYDGQIYALTNEALRVGHVGVYAPERAAYLDGGWKRDAVVHSQGEKLGPLSAETVFQWGRSWPHYESPQHLFPGRSVNDVSIASEMPPVGYYRKGHWHVLPGMRRWAFTRHTKEQHYAVARLAADIAQRYDWPDNWLEDPKGGPRSPRLLGHEDVDLFGRSDRGGGWDPGYLRIEPRWDWPLVYRAIRAILRGLAAESAV